MHTKCGPNRAEWNHHIFPVYFFSFFYFKYSLLVCGPRGVMTSIIHIARDWPRSLGIVALPHRQIQSVPTVVTTWRTAPTSPFIATSIELRRPDYRVQTARRHWAGKKHGGSGIPSRLSLVTFIENLQEDLARIGHISYFLG